MLRAVPAIMLIADSMLAALRSGIFCSAIFLTCSFVILATLVLFGTPEPLSMPPQELVVNISREGRYIVARQDLSEDQLAALLSEAGRKNPGTQSVLIRGDAESAWKAGVRVMGLCNRAGIVNYRVAVVQQK